MPGKRQTGHCAICKTPMPAPLRPRLGEAACERCGMQLWYFEFRGRLHYLVRDQGLSAKEHLVRIVRGESQTDLAELLAAVGAADSLDVAEAIIDL